MSVAYDYYFVAYFGGGGKNLSRMCQYFTPKIYIILFFVFLKRVKTIYKIVHDFCNYHPLLSIKSPK